MKKIKTFENFDGDKKSIQEKIEKIKNSVNESTYDYICDILDNMLTHMFSNNFFDNKTRVQLINKLEDASDNEDWKAWVDIVLSIDNLPESLLDDVLEYIGEIENDIKGFELIDDDDDDDVARWRENNRIEDIRRKEWDDARRKELEEEDDDNDNDDDNDDNDDNEYPNETNEWYFDVWVDKDKYEPSCIALSADGNGLDDQLGSHNLPQNIIDALNRAGIFGDSEMQEAVWEVNDYENKSKKDIIEAMKNQGFIYSKGLF